MDFISNQEPQIKEMLKVIGVNNIEELFSAIPKQLILPRPAVDDGLSEYEGLQLMQSLAEKNRYASFENYLGAGAYEHHVPSIVGAICSKSEFLTSYTPYQAETSQGMLQAIFEFQSAIAALTGMDVSNASLYDGASTCGEAVLMAMRVHKTRQKILVADTLHPHYKDVLDQYLSSHDLIVEVIPRNAAGKIDIYHLKCLLDSNTAAVLLQSPNFLGLMEDIKPLSAAIKESGALLILCANPLSYGIFASAGDLGADIAIGDCQPFGLPLQFGGPYAGYLSCRQEFVRQMPGRLIGETLDTEGRRGFVLTMQAREQHIRREKATSNICTNQALAALASLIAMLWYGKEGLPELALTNFQRASYLKAGLTAIPRVKALSAGTIFNEFAVSFSKPVDDVQAEFRAKGIEPGVALGRFYPDLQDYLLVAVTETKSQQQLDRYIQTAREIVGKL
ncbi:MAG: aminomethyl-transferring glycine dehydrogenase subunit GcvPA [Parachlamydiaceae bacterium]|nr:aminomethyl-transferring glycine dehydrogenase subunit GcvPA [Parachlamydiaceae bacterium]